MTQNIALAQFRELLTRAQDEDKDFTVTIPNEMVWQLQDAIAEGIAATEQYNVEESNKIDSIMTEVKNAARNKHLCAFTSAQAQVLQDEIERLTQHERCESMGRTDCLCERCFAAPAEMKSEQVGRV